MKRLASFLLILSPFFAYAQELEPGTIKPFQVRGDVQLMNNETGEITPLKRGQDFTQAHTIVTGNKSRALLLFSNGATISINENSSVNIERFTQAPFEKEVTGQYLVLKADPSTSDTLIKLNHGELVGKAKKLQSDSLYDVETPMGAAGVRGTTFLVSFYQPEETQYAMEVGNVEGQVALTTNMPANISVQSNNVGQTQFDPTRTLSSADVPEQSIVTLLADLNAIGPIENMPTRQLPQSFIEQLRRISQQDLIPSDIFPEANEVLEDLGLPPAPPTDDDGGPIIPVSPSGTDGDTGPLF